MKFPLALKWSITLLITSLTGVILVGLFAYQTTLSEYDRLRIEQAEAVVIEDLTTYYQEHQSWEGLEQWILETKLPPNGDPLILPFQMFALVDTEGDILLGNGPFLKGERVPAGLLEQGVNIVAADEIVAKALFATPPPGLNPLEQLYLERTTQSLMIGAGGAVLIALTLGVLLSRQFLRPLSELRTAITAMKRGDLNQRVKVMSRDELGELAETFNQMSAEIHRVNQLRRQMTADVAHDLRTPLMVIIGYLEALTDGTLSGTPDRYQAMAREANLLQRLIEDLRILSLADTGELKLICQPVKPDDLLKQVRQAFEPIAEQHKIKLVVQAGQTLPPVPVDRERMVQVLGNLVSNALRYTPQGGSVILTAYDQPEALHLEVHDTGTGIEPEKLPHIFERFYRTDESRHQYEGESGLGLAIAKSIIEAHGGTISASSQMGTGTTMLITLPLQKPRF